MKKNRKFNEVGLEINSEETKYILLFRHQKVEQNNGIKIANEYFENVAQFKYLWHDSKKSKCDSGGNLLATSKYRTFCLHVYCLEN
jgi:hypothetical protein